MSDEPRDLPLASHVYVMSLVGSRNMDPRVQIEIGDCKTQVNAAKAREIALMILEASEAAMSDAGMVKFLVEKVGMERNHPSLGALLQDFRTFRDEWDKKRDER